MQSRNAKGPGRQGLSPLSSDLFKIIHIFIILKKNLKNDTRWVREILRSSHPIYLFIKYIL